KGLRRLREAEVVLHERLAPPELLDEIAPGTTIIDVGKAPGRPCLGQGHINWLLVDWARRRGRVVRLKGGDPAIFGRLGEEIEAVRSAGVAFEVVPGVTAATAAAARAGISLTARGRASMLVLATGTDHTGRAPAALDWDVLARVEGTLVFYMPVGSLEAITASLTALGRDRREPAILIERVGMPDERVISGRLGGIADEARAAGLASPAILVTGPTVASASGPLGVRRMLPGGLHREALELLERPLLAHALALTGGNQLRAARLLGLNRNTLRKRCRELGLAVPRASHRTATPKPAPLA